MAHEIPGWDRETGDQEMAGRKRTVERGKEERLRPSGAMLQYHAPAERLQSPVRPVSGTQQVADQLAELIQELRPHVSVIAEQDSSKVLGRQVMDAATA